MKAPSSDQNPNAAPVQWIRAIIVWLLLMGAEVIHGTIRTLLLAPVVGDFRSRQIGVFTGSIIILAVVFLSIGWIGAKGKALIAVGVLWLVLTLMFEISLGHFVFGYPWERVVADFNVPKRGLLPIGLLIMAFSPVIAARIRKLR
jgi:hypothetical protein